MSAVLVEGELAIYRAVEFKDRLLAALSAAGEVEVDLSQVNEMDSAGVQLLLLTRREAMASGKRLRITATSQAAAEALRLCGLDAAAVSY